MLVLVQGKILTVLSPLYNAIEVNVFDQLNYFFTKISLATATQVSCQSHRKRVSGADSSETIPTIPAIRPSLTIIPLLPLSASARPRWPDG